MAIFRKINTNFWTDDKVIDDFTPEDKFFMLYLMTNPYTNQIGCYGITIKQMEFETGYNKETILKLLNRFEKVLKVIKYSESTKELLILNWHKYNWSNSPKVLACMLKEFKNIKNKVFRYSIDTLFKQYKYNIDTETQEEQEEEKEEEKEQEEEKEKNILENLFDDFYNKYPKKVAKENAKKKFILLLKSKKVSFEDLMNGLDKYLKHINKNKIERQYIKHPATWLNQGCWQDIYDEPITEVDPLLHNARL